VSAQLHTQIKTSLDDKPITSDDWALLNVRFGDVPGIIHITAGNYPRSSHTITIRAEDATIVFEVSANTRFVNQLSVTTNDGRINEFFVETSPPLPIGDHMWAKGTLEIGKAIHQALTSENPAKEAAKMVAATWEDGIYTQAVLDAARMSNKSNGVFVPIHLQ